MRAVDHRSSHHDNEGDVAIDNDSAHDDDSQALPVDLILDWDQHIAAAFDDLEWAYCYDGPLVDIRAILVSARDHIDAAIVDIDNHT